VNAIRCTRRVFVAGSAAALVVLMIGGLHGDAMRGDYSRWNPTDKDYRGVYMQQGRVLLDSDWNEAQEIALRLRETSLADVIGPFGAPIDEAGFGVRPMEGGSDLRITPGRMYVGGMLCELKTAVTYRTQPNLPEPEPLVPSAGRRDLVVLDVWRRTITAVEDPELIEPALGGVDTTTRTQTVWQVKLMKDVGELSAEDASLEARPSPGTGRLSTSLVAPDEQDPVLLAPTGGYTGMENRLYRIEIHEGGGAGTATFKWSRSNASTTYVIEAFRLGGAEVVLAIPTDVLLRPQPGSWVEISGDETDLRGQPGTMARVVAVDPGSSVVRLDRAVTQHASEGHPKLIAWDHPGSGGGGGNLRVQEGAWLPLEDGIAFRFTPGGTYRSGDYWLFAARAANGSVEILEDVASRGMEHAFCPLALLDWYLDGDAWNADVQDCRRLFYPLTELSGTESGPPTHEEERRFFGKYRALVVDNDDPWGRGRIRALVPDILGDGVSDWAVPCLPCAALHNEERFIPEIEQWVWMEFEAGDPSRPIWVGCIPPG